MDQDGIEIAGDPVEALIDIAGRDDDIAHRRHDPGPGTAGAGFVEERQDLPPELAAAEREMLGQHNVRRGGAEGAEKACAAGVEDEIRGGRAGLVDQAGE